MTVSSNKEYHEGRMVIILAVTGLLHCLLPCTQSSRDTTRDLIKKT